MRYQDLKYTICCACLSLFLDPIKRFVMSMLFYELAQKIITKCLFDFCPFDFSLPCISGHNSYLNQGTASFHIHDKNYTYCHGLGK